MSASLSIDERRQLRLRACADPVWFLRRAFGVRPWSLQRRILESVRDNRRTVVRSCHGAGKSHVAALATLWFLYTRPDSIVITTAPTATQVNRIIWQEIRRVLARARRPMGGTIPPRASELFIRDGWFAFGFATDKPERAAGLHSGDLLLIFDEACGIHPRIWEAFEGALSGERARMLGIGNPILRSGPFYDEFKPGSDAACFAISAFDTPNLRAGREVIPGLVTREWVDERRKRWGEGSPMYVARVLGQFPEELDNVLVHQTWWDLACERDLSEEQGTVELGVDVGGDGDGSDYTVIGCRNGSVYRTAWRRNGHNTMEVVGAIRRTQREYTRGDIVPRAKVDAIGIGKGVVDRLAEDRLSHAGMWASRAARNADEFVNARAEWFWGLRERFDPEHPMMGGKIDVSAADEELGAQLTSIRWGTTPTGKIYIESKEAMKRRGMRSPDDADAMAMAFAESGFDDAGLAIDLDEAREPGLFS